MLLNIALIKIKIILIDFEIKYRKTKLMNTQNL